jgi:SAM-dependent methyltransferase
MFDAIVPRCFVANSANQQLDFACRFAPVLTVNWRDTLSLKSLDLIRACGLQADDPVIHVSGGTPLLIESLLDAGLRDLTVVNGSSAELEALSACLGDRANRVTLIEHDVIGFHPHRRYALWHDGEIFHSLTHAEERQQYLESLEEALRPGGHLVISTFGPDGPQEYGGLPVRCYSARTLPEELGSQFELADHSLSMHQAPSGEVHEYLHCRFRRHAPG